MRDNINFYLVPKIDRLTFKTTLRSHQLWTKYDLWVHHVHTHEPWSSHS